MCLFPLPNENTNSIAYKKGVKEFDCGACPECLRKRSNIWALRAVYEAKSHVNNCMITLTYDTFKYNSKGEIIGENPVNSDLIVNKRHIQLFIKRLRKWWSTVSHETIKYICCAEYGSRTHRAHYHLILFGVKFSDMHYYKKSKRGNVIYMSKKLTDLWSHGICTIDSVNVHSAVARYCTKYCAKSRSDKTFMLCSQRIGLVNLMKDFNGRSYFIDGREYPVPRLVWNEYIINKYKYRRYASVMSYKYVNCPNCVNWFDTPQYAEFLKANKRRSLFRSIRDRDPLYIAYLDYWKRKGNIFNYNKPSVITRINLLPDNKYHNYKIAALNCYNKRLVRYEFPAPGSNCASAFERWKLQNVSFVPSWFGHLPLPPRPNRASDTKKIKNMYCCPFDNEILYENEFKLLTFTNVHVIM